MFEDAIPLKGEEGRKWVMDWTRWLNEHGYVLDPRLLNRNGGRLIDCLVPPYRGEK